MNNKLVSIIIPTYGRPEYLGRAIDSVLNQTYKNLEVIVVDDNPKNTENRKLTEELMENYSSFKQVVYLKHEMNKRVGAARNTGLVIARGDYISFLDDDDEFNELKLFKQVGFLNENQNYGGCYCRFESYSKGMLTRRSNYTEEGDLTKDVYLFKCTGNASCYMFRREVLVALKGFNENLPRHEDFELLVRFFQSNKMGFVDYLGVKRHTDSRINMPSIEQYIAIKNAFFDALVNELGCLSKSKYKKIRRIHQADVFFYALRQKQFTKAITLFPYPLSAFQYLIIKTPNILEILKRKVQ